MGGVGNLPGIPPEAGQCAPLKVSESPERESTAPPASRVYLPLFNNHFPEKYANLKNVRISNMRSKIL